MAPNWHYLANKEQSSQATEVVELGAEVKNRISFWICAFLYRSLVTTGLVLVAAVITAFIDGAPMHVASPVSAVSVPFATNPHATGIKHSGTRNEKAR